MTSCNIEAFNAFWSAAGFGFAAVALVALARKAWTKAQASDGMSGDGYWITGAMALGLMGLAAFWGSHHGQNGVRYLHAATVGYECHYDSGGKVTIIR